MFRITRLLQIAKPLINASSLYFKPAALVFSNRMWFSEKTADKIFEIIENGDVEQNLDRILMDVKALDDEMREQVIEAILQKIFDRELPPRVILDQKFALQLKKHPLLHFEAYYFRAVQSINRLDEYINGQDKKVKMVIAKQISDSFIICFQDLKKIEPKASAPKQIQLLRSFAHYNFYYLSRLVDPAKQHECINKSRECYKLTLVKSTALLKSLTKEEQQLIKNANPHETLQQKQERQDELQELDELKFQVMEEYSQVVSEMLGIEDEIFQRSKQNQEYQSKEQKQKEAKQQIPEQTQQQIEFQMPKQTLWLQPAIEKAVKNYERIPHRMMESKYYYKLRKILLDVKHQIKLRELVASKKNKEEREQQVAKINQQTKEKMHSLYQDAIDEMKKIQSQELQSEAFADHIMVMLSTKLDQFVIELGEGEGQMSEKKIGEEVQKLVNFIADQNTKKKALSMVIQKVRETFDVKIDSYVQKVPRKVRTQRRRRVEEDQQEDE